MLPPHSIGGRAPDFTLRPPFSAIFFSLTESFHPRTEYRQALEKNLSFQADIYTATTITARFSSFSQVTRFKLLAMTMTFSIHESIDPNGAFEMIFNSHPAPGAPYEDRPIVREKLRIPKTDAFH
jgi:hypothetical protein